MPQKSASKKSESDKRYQERVQRVLSEIEERKWLAREERRMLNEMMDCNVISRVSSMSLIFPLVFPWRPILPIEVDTAVKYVRETALSSIWSLCVSNPRVKYEVDVFSIKVVSLDNSLDLKFYTFLVMANCPFNDKLHFLSKNKDFIDFVLNTSLFCDIDETNWD